MPNGTAIYSTPIGTLPMPGLSAEATKAFIFDSLHSPLLSTGQLCDADCISTFIKHYMTGSHDDDTIFTSHHDASTNCLWQMGLPLAVPFPLSLGRHHSPSHQSQRARCLLPCLPKLVSPLHPGAVASTSELNVFPG